MLGPLGAPLPVLSLFLQAVERGGGKVGKGLIALSARQVGRGVGGLIGWNAAVRIAFVVPRPAAPEPRPGRAPRRPGQG